MQGVGSVLLRRPGVGLAPVVGTRDEVADSFLRAHLGFGAQMKVEVRETRS